jgi:hypothetical protein
MTVVEQGAVWQSATHLSSSPAHVPMRKYPAGDQGGRKVTQNRNASMRLSNEQLQEAFALMKRADSVELKLSIPESHQRSTLQALDIDPLDAQIRQVYFFDTPDLALNKSGLVVRARRVQGKPSDSVVKLRPIDPIQISKEIRTSPNFGVEVDAMPGGYVCSGSMKGVVEPDIVRDTVSGKNRLRKLFSREQRSFFQQHAPAGLELEGLSALGPIFVLKLRFTPKEFKQRVVIEMWLYPDGSRVLELSAKCTPEEALNTAMETRAFLAQRGIDTTADQQTKTKRALNFFSKELTSQAANTNT